MYGGGAEEPTRTFSSCFSFLPETDVLTPGHRTRQYIYHFSRLTKRNETLERKIIRLCEPSTTIAFPCCLALPSERYKVCTLERTNPHYRGHPPPTMSCPVMVIAHHTCLNCGCRKTVSFVHAATSRWWYVVIHVLFVAWNFLRCFITTTILLASSILLLLCFRDSIIVYPVVDNEETVADGPPPHPHLSSSFFPIFSLGMRIFFLFFFLVSSSFY